MSDVCGDDRFEVIAEAKKDLLELTNIDTDADEMAVLDSFLLRCWQMGWLRQYESFEFCTDCKEYDHEKHCCHRWTKFIRQTVEELKANERTAKVQELPRRSETSLDWKGICSNCGAYTNHDMNFCFECGAKLDWSE